MFDLTQQRYCPFCGGTELERIPQRMTRCGTCGSELFQNASAAVSVVLQLPDGRVVLAQRAHDPNKGKWDFPGGFVDAPESFEDAAVREIHEELGITLSPSVLRYLCSGSFTYPYKGVTTLGVDIHFLAPISEETYAQCRAADDVAQIALYDPREISRTLVSCDSVYRAVTALRVIQ